MKKKLLLFTAIFILISGVYILACRGLGVSTGIYLKTEDNVSILIKNETPIVMSVRTEKNVFDGIKNGEKIIVIHDGIAETYPAKTGAYAVFKIKNSDNAEIPEAVIKQLTDLGWLKAGYETADIT